MVRFIFVCMAVVALSVIAIATQSIMDGVSDETANIAARNMEEPVTQDVALETPVAEDLNTIETTAGGNYDPNDTFKGDFTNQAPKALEDSVQMGTSANAPDASRDIPVAGPPVAQQPSSN